MRSSTATGTTATADATGRYRGRFAPSPTGLLHVGSLMTALASWLDARACGGQWLLRMEDLDGPRNRPGTAGEIIATLDALGLVADGPVQFQSGRTALYARAFGRLRAKGLVYRCTCSRSRAAHPYAGTCRDAGHPEHASGAWRLRLPQQAAWTFSDRYQGCVTFPASAVGDPVLIRRDGIVAYQFAVVVDDLGQGITDVVRGADLLDSTPWQIAIAEALGAAPPRFAHVPLLVEADGRKLAKSRRSLPIHRLEPGKELLRALTLLRQHPPQDLAGAPVTAILEWATAHWSPGAFALQREIPVTQAGTDLGLPA